MVELFKHKERIAQISELHGDELLECLHELLCRDVDLKDTPFVALTLHLDGCLWTSDEQLKTGLRSRSFDRFFKP